MTKRHQWAESLATCRADCGDRECRSGLGRKLCHKCINRWQEWRHTSKLLAIIARVMCLSLQNRFSAHMGHGWIKCDVCRGSSRLRLEKGEYEMREVSL
eukprot:6211027-Pleurochrysis_carterae.AAC.3